MKTKPILGRRIGRAIARDVVAEQMPRQWTGLDPQDADVLTRAGVQPGTRAWDRITSIAEDAYLAYLRESDARDLRDRGPLGGV